MVAGLTFNASDVRRFERPVLGGVGKGDDTSQVQPSGDEQNGDALMTPVQSALVDALNGVRSGDLGASPLNVTGEESLQEATSKLGLKTRDLHDQVRRFTGHDVTALPDLDAPEPPNDSQKSVVDDLMDEMEKLRNGLLDPIANASKEYGKFYAKLLEALASLSKGVSGDPKDSNYVRFNSTEGKTRLRELVGAYKDKILASFGSQEDAQRFLDRVGLDNLRLEKNDTTGKWVIKIKMDAVNNIIGSLPSHDAGKDYAKMDTAAYNAWLSSKDARQDIMQNMNRVLLDRFSRDYQLWENGWRAIKDFIDAIFNASRQKVDRI